jgi:hypothetical protein
MHFADEFGKDADLDYAESVQFFFSREPFVDGDQKVYSTLCLILNDIQTCKDMNILAFPRAMCLMVAVDLLGKMYNGCDKPRKEGERFTKWLKKFVPNVDCDQIWAFRNALHHSYKMPTSWRPDGDKNREQNLRFRLIDAPDRNWSTCLVKVKGEDLIFVNLSKLEDVILEGVGKYKDNSIRETDQKKQESFVDIYKKYGSLPIVNVALPSVCD